MKTVIMGLIISGLIILVLITAINSSDGDPCKSTTTMSEYRLCKALERCEQFDGDLRFDCEVNVFLD